MKSGQKVSESRQEKTSIQPVLLGGDIGVYALARQFYEARGVVSICVSNAPIEAIKYSNIVKVYENSNQQNDAKQNKTEQSQNRAEQNNTTQNNTGQNNNQYDNTQQNNALSDNGNQEPQQSETNNADTNNTDADNTDTNNTDIDNSVDADLELLETLLEIAAQNQNKNQHKQLILLANFDKYVEFAAKNRDILEQAGYIVPFPELDVIENVTDKSNFSQLCNSLDIPTPHTIVVDFSNTTDKSERRNIGEKHSLQFPLVAKPSYSAAYANVIFPGKKKVYYIQNDNELNQLFEALEQHGFNSKFLVQELIPGDDTAMRSITMYVDSRGKVSLFGSARVLLEDHHPNMLGNPVAMITDPLPKLWEQAEKLLLSSNYRGFANFDIKVDPRNGTPYFLEVNPRIGRNSYYMTAAGTNPLEYMIQDLVEGQELERIESTEQILYSLVPINLLKRYLSDPKQVKEVDYLVKNQRVYDPLECPAETSLLRKTYVWVQKMNHYRKFKKYYPECTDSAF